MNLRTLEDEILDFHSRQPIRVMIPLFLLAVVIWGIVVQHLPLLWPSIWLGFVVLVLALRWFIEVESSRFRSMSTDKRLKAITALYMLHGISHGLSLFFFLALAESERAIQSMLLVGVAAGAVGSAGACLPMYLAYVTPILIPLSLLWAISAFASSSWWIESTIALLIVFLGLILLGLARDSSRFFKESFDIRSKEVELNSKLRFALSIAETANHAKTRFLASASHDLRQPLHTLSIFAAALSMRQLDERSRTIVKHMNEALDDLSSELDSLLDISKLDAGVIAVTRKKVSLGLLLQNTYEAFLPDACAKQLRFEIYCPDEVCTDTDKVLLERVVRNLVQNAIKYTFSGSVVLKVETGKDFHSLIIEDTGPGIPESEHFRIFEEFYQIDNPERDRARGLGLGLAIVKRLIDLLGIEITLTSLLGVGTSFTLKLPISNYVDEIVDSRSLKTSQAFGGLHVLVVDDETKIRLGMRELLEGMGCRVSDVDNSAAALRCATANSIDFVLADFRLREGDNGIATIQAIRKIVPLVPALLISGDTAPERLREATEAGITLLHKPVSLNLLKSEIAKGLQKDTENYDDKSK